MSWHCLAFWGRIIFIHFYLKCVKYTHIPHKCCKFLVLKCLEIYKASYLFVSDPD